MVEMEEGIIYVMKERRRMGWSYFLYFASQEEEKAVEEKELEDW